MRRFPRVLVVLAILVLCVGCDQATKALAASRLEQVPTISLLGDTVRLQYAENTGAFLGLGSSLSPSMRTWLFVFVMGPVLVAMLVYLLRVRRIDLWSTASIALVVAGGFGNLIDRIWLGFVRDFANLGIGPVRTGIFNVADVAITVGAVLLLTTAFRKSENGGKHG